MRRCCTWGTPRRMSVSGPGWSRSWRRLRRASQLEIDIIVQCCQQDGSRLSCQSEIKASFHALLFAVAVYVVSA